MQTVVYVCYLHHIVASVTDDARLSVHWPRAGRSCI